MSLRIGYRPAPVRRPSINFRKYRAIQVCVFTLPHRFAPGCKGISATIGLQKNRQIKGLISVGSYNPLRQGFILLQCSSSPPYLSSCLFGRTFVYDCKSSFQTNVHLEPFKCWRPLTIPKRLAYLSIGLSKGTLSQIRLSNPSCLLDVLISANVFFRKTNHQSVSFPAPAQHCRITRHQHHQNPLATYFFRQSSNTITPSLYLVLFITIHRFTPRWIIKSKNSDYRISSKKPAFASLIFVSFCYD